MAIKLPTPPDGGDRILREHNVSKVRSRDVSAASSGQRVFATQPHRVYAVERDAILHDELLSAAYPVAWRYLLVDTDQTLAAAELLQDSSGGALVYSETNSGSFVQSTADVLATAERLDDVERGDFELRLLRAPAVYLVALWLHGDDTDILLPLDPAPAHLVSGQPYSPTEILAAVRTLAAKQVAFETQERG